MVMEGSGFLWVLLLCGRVLLVSSEFQCVSVKERERATLPCGKLTEGKVTWSREINGERENILTTHNGQITRHISDPYRRYGSGPDIVLRIFRVSQSDAGRYYCNGSTVKLIVNGNCPVRSITASFSLPTSTTRTTPAKGPEASTTTTVEHLCEGPVISTTTSFSLPTSTTRTTSAKRPEDSTTTTAERSAKEIWMVFIAVGSVLLLLALASLLSTKCFPKKNAEEDDVTSGDVYTTIEYVNIIKS